MKKILLVDDEEEMSFLLANLLKHHGYEVDTAYNGIEALNKVASAYSNHQSFDLILLDILMPEMDGKEVLANIREEEKSRGIPIGEGIPIIILTASPHEIENSYQLGCDNFVSKPFKDNELIQTIEKVLS